MNRWIRRALTSLSITGAVALTAGSVALAQQAQSNDARHGHGHAHRAGLLGEALKLDSLSADQRTAIEQLVDLRRTASIPVRHADAQVLTALAHEVETSAIDSKALAPALSAEDSAAAAESAVEKDAITRLHALLTPAQRGQLVDRVEADHGHAEGGVGRGMHGMWGGKLGLTPEQKTQIAANLRAEWQGAAGEGGKGAHRGARFQALETFRGDSFDANSLVFVERRGERAEKFAEAMVPVLTPAQRGEFAEHLRARAARESRI